MPQLSRKGIKLPTSPIRKLVVHSDEAKARGIEVFHLNIGQPDIAAPVEAIQAVKKSDLTLLPYGPSQGSLTYRQKLCKYYEKHAIEIVPDDILVTTGASEALTFALNVICDAGDEIIIPEPFYANYNGFSIANSLKIVPVISKIENNFSLPEIEDFEKLITKKTKAILICNPNNPTGYLYSKNEIKKLVEIVKKHDLFLIADEVYREFTYDGESHYSIMQESTIDQNAIMIDSVSKRYSMCGARIGCVVSKNKKVIETVLKFAQSRLSPPTYAQIASEAALDTPEIYFEEINKKYIQRRNLLISELRKIKGLKVASPKGAFYCIVELPIKDANQFAQWMLEKFNVNNETIMVAPAEGFYSTKGLGKNQIRIAYVLKEEDLKKSVTILKKALDKYIN